MSNSTFVSNGLIKANLSSQVTVLVERQVNGICDNRQQFRLTELQKPEGNSV